jgi:hypothetical protein
MRSLYLVFIVLGMLTLFAPGCTTSTKSRNKCGPCPEIAEQLPNLNFRVVDKTTGNDLFFGAGAPYKISQLVMHHLVNGKPDSVFMRVDTASHSFYIFDAPNHPIDTVTMNIASLPQDIITFNTTVTGGCCPFLVLNSISYDGTVVFTNKDAPHVVVLQK